MKAIRKQFMSNQRFPFDLVYAKKRKVYKTQLTASERDQFETWLDGMQQELKGKEPGFRHAILYQLQFIVLQLSRGLTPQHRKEVIESTAGPAWMKKTLQYIDGHLATA